MAGHFHRGTIVHGNTNSNSNGVKKIGHTGSSADGYAHSYMQLDGSEFLYQCGYFNSCVNADVPSYVTNYEGSCTQLDFSSPIPVFSEIYGIYVCPADRDNVLGSWETSNSTFLNMMSGAALNGYARATSSTAFTLEWQDESSCVIRYTLNNSFANANSANGIGRIYWQAWGKGTSAFT